MWGAAVAAVIRRGWDLVDATHGIDDKYPVRVHSACAGLVNAGFLAVERAMKERGVTARLVVASEAVPWIREGLQLQYPGTVLLEDAGQFEEYTRNAHILVASWPCKPYSSANVEGRTSPRVWRKRVWENTHLVCKIIAGACMQQGGPPRLLVLENVPGLKSRRKCWPMLRHILAEMALTPYTWFSQIVCAREHAGVGSADGPGCFW